MNDREHDDAMTDEDTLRAFPPILDAITDKVLRYRPPEKRWVDVEDVRDPDL